MGKTLGYGEITVANMTEPFTVMLTNEAQQFATDSNRKVTSAQSYYTDIIVIRGSQERTDYTIGNITSGSGITVSKNNKRVTFSVSAGATIGADTGVIEIPITLDGQTVKKQFSWSCGKQGIQGVKGTDGDSFAWNMLSHSSMIGEKIVCQYIEPCNSVITYQYTDEGYHIVTPSSGNANNGIVIRFDNYKDLGIDDGESISFSCDIKGSTSSKPCIAIRMGDNLWYGNDVVGKSATFTPTNNWQRFSVSTTTPSNLTKRHIWLAIHGNLQSDLYIKNLKLEKGISATPWSPSQSDIEGKGIAQIVQYYLATSQATGVTSSTSGWSTDITTQKLTADKKYLWNCSQTKYTDGTSEPITTPTIIGAYGDKGETGADGQDGAGFHWNLLKYSGDLSQMSYGKVGGYIDTQEFISDASTPSKNVLKSTITTVGNGIYIQGKYLKKEAIKKGNTYTVSAWCKCSSAKDIGVMNVEFLDKKVNISMPKLSTEWQQYIITGVANKDVTTTSSGSAISFYYGNKLAVGDIFYISSPKVEEGDKASPWCTTYEETLAKNLTITPSAQIFKSTDGGNTFAPNQITITPTLQGDITFGKWQYSIDGGVSFADVVSGQSGLSVDTNKNLTIAKTSGLFTDKVTMVTFRAVASDSSFYDTCSIAKLYDVSDIGDGRNLLWNSNFAKTDEAINTSTYTTWGLILRGNTYTATIDTSVKHNNFNTLKVIGTKAGENGGQDLIYRIKGLNLDEIKFTETGVKYTLSFYAKASIACNFSARYAYDSYAKDTNVALSTDWKRYEIQMHPTTTSYQTSLIFKMDAASTVWFSEFKLEKGSSATGYSTAPEDVQTAILSTKSEISDVSLKVDNNKQAIEQRVEKTTYQQDLKLVKGDISKANEGLNKWRYEIYPKSLFTDKPEDQRKISLDVFARNKNIIPTQSILLDDTKLGYFNYDDNYIGYAVTFVKMSEATKLETTFVHDDAGSFYLNGKLICTNGTNNFYSSATPDTVSCTLVKGWNCLEVVINEGAGSEGFKFGTVLSQLSTCQLMNCYYAMVTGRESQITNTLVQNTIDIEGVSTKVGKVTSIIGENGENFTDFKNDYSDFKQTMNGFKTTVGQTYVTKDDFNGLEIGGRNLLLYSQAIRAHNSYYDAGQLTDEVETFNGCPVWSVKNQWGRLVWSFKSHVIDRGLVKVGDTLTYSLYAKTNNTSGKRIACSYRFKGNAQAYWFKGSAFNIGTSWARYSATFTVTKDMLATDTYMNEIGFEETASMSGDDKVYYACPKLERGTKATDYTEAPEDNEINGQNLVSNLPSNWEQGSINYTANLAYGSLKSTLVSRLRTKDVFPVSGNIAISAGTSTNSSKEELNFYYVLFDINKKSISHGDTWQSLTSPKIINCGDAKYMAIILRWGSGSTAITPSDISQICLKIERGTSATPFTLAAEDVNGKIVNVETIANQTANKFSWIVKSGTSSSNFEITDRLMNLVSANINLDGIVSFMNTAKGDGRKNLYNLDYSSFENVASQENAICYAKDNGVTSVGIDSSVSYDGNKSLKISYTTANLNSSTTPLYLGSSANNYGCVKIQAGKQYILSCYVKSDSTTGMFMIDIQGHDTPDTKTGGLYLSNIDPRRLPGSSTGVNLSTDWQRAVCAIKVAENATGLYWSVVPLIWGKPSSSSAPKTFNVWVDCIMLEEVDSISNQPGTYILDKETIVDGGSIKTDTITGNQILAGSITADKIDVNSIFAKDITATGTITGANLIGATGTFSGEITATKGSIAGWTIISDKMYTTGSGKYTGIGKYGSAYAFWAGATSNDNGNSAVFKVGHTGKLTATNADITGTITATNGKIGRYDITSTYLMTNNGSNASGIGGDQAFWAGAEDSNSAPFRVGYDGVLWAENAAIRGSIETGNLGDEGDTVSIINGHIGIQGPSNNVEIYSTGFKFGIDGDYYLESVSDGVKCYRNLYATDLKASGWLYAGEVHSSGAVVIASDSESFYWAHGYQIARGTSWGGVCIGDDSQGLRLYGTSIWASHGISTSDENLKENFTTLDQYEDFYMNLNPIGFNYIGDYDGKKTHFGFGAHKTEDILESEGYDSDKFAVVTHRPLVQEDIEKRFGKDVEVDIETEYGISYTEFIALNTHMIQKTRRELTKVKQEKADLEARLQAIEAKLGL